MADKDTGAELLPHREISVAEMGRRGKLQDKRYRGDKGDKEDKGITFNLQLVTCNSSSPHTQLGAVPL
ncbi:MAG: hypothetical protein BRC37_08545 [Cyanobacteria bacterium QH_3_48_40]|nr:MAG: hypothetical protein BRC37_08545 [Cyanobacteria bacterium QH_3_48_40]